MATRVADPYITRICQWWRLPYGICDVSRGWAIRESPLRQEWAITVTDKEMIMTPSPADPATSSTGAARDGARSWTLLLSFLILALALGLGWVRMQPPRALDVDVPPDRFSAGRAMEVLHRLLAEE
jgi:hypothetical protein